MAVNYRAVRTIARRSSHAVTTWIRQTARHIARRAPVLLDVAAFVAITIGVGRLAGDWAWIVAGGLLMLAAIRAQDTDGR